MNTATIPPITHVRKKPCMSCKSHIFYIASRRCKDCTSSKGKSYREANKEQRIKNSKKWCEENLGYLRKYRAAYRLRKQDELAVLIAVLLMTSHNQKSKERA